MHTATCWLINRMTELAVLGTYICSSNTEIQGCVHSQAEKERKRARWTHGFHGTSFERAKCHLFGLLGCQAGSQNDPATPNGMWSFQPRKKPYLQVWLCAAFHSSSAATTCSRRDINSSVALLIAPFFFYTPTILRSILDLFTPNQTVLN